MLISLKKYNNIYNDNDDNNNNKNPEQPQLFYSCVLYNTVKN